MLDLGCGPGHITGYLRSLGADATGIDIVPEFIAHAKAAHPSGNYQLGSMEDLDVADHSVTGILAWYSLIHLPPNDLDGVLTEFRRVLVPGGPLVVGFFDGDEVAAFDHKVVTAYRWSVDELSERLTRATSPKLSAGVEQAMVLIGRTPPSRRSRSKRTESTTLAASSTAALPNARCTDVAAITNHLNLDNGVRLDDRRT